MTAGADANVVETPDALSAADRQAMRDLILTLADSKRLLGLRYADWTLGAPELEAGIACASMAQDEWGHARQLYALLRDFGEDSEALEHGREPAEYASMEVLDQAGDSWFRLVALNALVDTALTHQIEALRESAYAPLRQRCEKLLDEERFHRAHGAAWWRRIAGAGDEARDALRAAAADVLPAVMRWFGPAGGRSGAMVEAGLVADGPDELRCSYVGRIGELLDLVDARELVDSSKPDFDGFDEATRRPTGVAPDARAIEQVRGDRNRAFLMD